MKISFSFFKQLLELLTSDWRSYLNKVITELEKLALTDTNDTFLKEECYRKMLLLKDTLKKVSIHGMLFLLIKKIMQVYYLPIFTC